MSKTIERVRSIFATLACIILFASLFSACATSAAETLDENKGTGIETSPSTFGKGKTLKILAIGNSFSEDNMEYLYRIAETCGYEKGSVVLGNMYIGGASLATHWEHAQSEAADYIFHKNSDGTWDTWYPDDSTAGTSPFLYGLTSEDWGIIVMQQGSGDSGKPDSYQSYLDNLVKYVNENKTNPDAVLAWNMTWSYQQGADHPAFPDYDNDQLAMYKAIADTVQRVVVESGDFNYIIPTGTVVQNLRGSYIGDTLNRDGYHLESYKARYITALTWMKVLTGADIEKIRDPIFTPLTKEEWSLVMDAIHAAIRKPFEVTSF